LAVAFGPAGGSPVSPKEDRAAREGGDHAPRPGSSLTVTRYTASCPFLDLIEKYATDERNFVKKAVNWALRQIGKRSAALHPPALELARNLAAADDRTARWIGKDAVRELTDPAQLARLNRKAKPGR
jgi:hypothetical protein